MGGGLYRRRNENRSTGTAAEADTHIPGKGREQSLQNRSKGKRVRPKQGADVGSAEWSL